MSKLWRVVVKYDDPRGGIWRGPIESRENAEKRLAKEAERVRGRVWLENIG